MIKLWHSSMPTFPWDDYYALMRNDRILGPQLEDGVTPPDERALRQFEGDPRRTIWLIADEDVMLGFVMLEQRGVRLKEVHTSWRAGSGQLRKRVWSFILAREFEWGTHSIIAIIPAFNHPARHLAIACGLRPAGLIPSSFLRDGKMCDSLIYAITKD